MVFRMESISGTSGEAIHHSEALGIGIPANPMGLKCGDMALDLDNRHVTDARVLRMLGTPEPGCKTSR